MPAERSDLSAFADGTQLAEIAAATGLTIHEVGQAIRRSRRFSWGDGVRAEACLSNPVGVRSRYHTSAMRPSSTHRTARRHRGARNGTREVRISSIKRMTT